MRKKALSALLAAILLLTILTGCNGDPVSAPVGGHVSSQGESSTLPPGSSVLSQTSATPQIIGEDDGVRIIRFREESDECYIHVLYGAFKVKELDAMIKDEVYRRIDRFQQRRSTSMSETSRNDTYLTMQYKQVRYDADTITLAFESNEMRQGQFIHDSFAFCVNTSTGERKYLKDFVDFDGAKAFLVEQSVQAILKQYPQLEEGYVRDKVDANLKDTSDFIIEPDTLTLLFDADLFGMTQYGVTIRVPVSRGEIETYLKEKKEAENSQGQTPQDSPAEPPAGTPTPPAEGDKVVCLTFDDGPHPANTPALLDLLGQYQAKATFFVVGNRAETYGQVLSRAAAEGHAVGNHTYSHANLTKLSAGDKLGQVTSGAQAIENACGVSPKLIRPPYGARAPGETEIAGERVTLWDVDPQDWKYKDPQRVASHILSHVQSGSIVLLHDLYATSVEAAGIVLQELSAQGYRFVTVEELWGL